ncbi:MAG: DUF2249 domain-containing protein [Gammaproteobacteria bacterium]|nr:DUF2249 domain-containing protein [Gammaproteobacteria bacterium]
MTGIRALDVSALAPPEPMERILAALESLAPGECLRVLHRREPWPLFPLLEQRGFAHAMRPYDPPGFVILIWRADDGKAAEAARNA